MNSEDIFNDDLKSILTGVFSKQVLIKNNTDQIEIQALVDDSQYVVKSDGMLNVADHNIRISFYEFDVPFSVKTKNDSNKIKVVMNNVEYIATEWTSINDGRITLYLNRP